MTTATMTKTRGTRRPKADAEIRVRLDSKTKDKAARAFKRHGLSTADGMRRLIDNVIADDDPWLAHKMSPHLPDAESLIAIEESLSGKGQKYTPEEFRKFLEEA